mgnify:CR=1 FL=1
MGKQEFFGISEGKKKSTKGTFVLAPVIFLALLSVILALGGAILLRKFFESRELARTTAIERDHFALRSDSLLIELQNLDIAFNKLKVENQSISEQISRHRREINGLRAQIAQLAGPEFESTIEGVQARITHLESELAKFQIELSGALDANRKMADEHSQVQLLLDAAKKRAGELETVKKSLTQKVDMGSRLTVVNLEILPTFFNRSGEQITNQARRVTQFRVCFTILQNLIAPPGERVFYLRVVDEAGNIALIQPVGNFNGPEGTPLEYLASKTINYQNKDLAECIGITIPSALAPGIYTASIYADGIELRSRVFELR